MPTDAEVMAAEAVMHRANWTDWGAVARAALEAAEAVRKQSDRTTTRNPDACQRRLTSNGTTCDRCGQETSATTAVMPQCPYNAPAPGQRQSFVGMNGAPDAPKLEPLPLKDWDWPDDDPCLCYACIEMRLAQVRLTRQPSEVAPTPATQPTRQDYHTSAIPGDGIETAGPLPPIDNVMTEQSAPTVTSRQGDINPPVQWPRDDWTTRQSTPDGRKNQRRTSLRD